MRAIHVLIVSALATGCGTAPMQPRAADHQGMAEFRVDAGPSLAVNLTRVTVEAAGQSQDLAANAGGVFTGAMLLPTGMQTLVARAFSGDTQVGASQPTTVAVTAGIVTRVMLRILDTTDTRPIFGPIFDSLVFPTSVEAGSSGTFTISVVAPAHDPVTYSWTSSCADSVFSAPDAATTSWSRPAPGGCEIDVVATSNGFTVAQSFDIVVFPSGANSGAVDINGVFVAAPILELDLESLHCDVSPGTNASCASTLASPVSTIYKAVVFSWGVSTPGTIEVSDDCRGRVTRDQTSPDLVGGTWLPPVRGGLCTVTARAVNGDGVAGTISAAVLTRPGAVPTTQPTGRAPISVAVADVSGDGKPDVVTANLGSDSVTVLLGNGDGSIRTIVDYPAGQQPVSLAVADVSGDGKPDLIEGNQGDGTVSVLLGNGDGTFRAKVDYTVGGNPRAVAVADISGDGKPDLVVAANSGTVSVLLGNGDGSFRAQVDYPAGSRPSSVAIADVNGDHKLDLAVANGDSVSVLLADGAGAFQAHIDFPTGSEPFSVAVADVSGDGNPDLVVANLFSSTVSVLLGNGDGSFQAKVDYATGEGPRSVVVADVSGDGKPDLVVGATDANTVSVLLGNGDGTFQPKVDYPTGSSPWSLAVADVSGDGRPDVVAANINVNTVSILFGTGNGRF